MRVFSFGEMRVFLNEIINYNYSNEKKEKKKYLIQDNQCDKIGSLMVT